MCSEEYCGERGVCDSLDMLECEAEACQEIAAGWTLAYWPIPNINK